MSKSSFSKIKAASLVEVLVSMAIIAVAMVVVTQVTVIAIIQIKDNEILEYVNGLMLEASEVSKSPAQVTLASAQGSVSVVTGSYLIQRQTGQVQLFQHSNTTIPITSCTPASPYYVSTTQAFGVTTPEICLQIIVEQQAATRFRLNITSVTNLRGNTHTSNFVSFRRLAF